MELETFIVRCTEKVIYEIPVTAYTAEEAIEKVKDNLPGFEEAINSGFCDFEAEIDPDNLDKNYNM